MSSHVSRWLWWCFNLSPGATKCLNKQSASKFATDIHVPLRCNNFSSSTITRSVFHLSRTLIYAQLDVASCCSSCHGSLFLTTGNSVHNKTISAQRSTSSWCFQPRLSWLRCHHVNSVGSDLSCMVTVCMFYAHSWLNSLLVLCQSLHFKRLWKAFICQNSGHCSAHMSSLYWSETSNTPDEIKDFHLQPNKQISLSFFAVWA